MGELFNNVMAPLEYAVSWILITIHTALVNLGVPADSGLSWGPSIIVLVIIVRILLIPLFVKQIKAQRGLQLLQPKMQELRKKYGSDRQRMSEELMKLYKEPGPTRSPAACRSWPSHRSSSASTASSTASRTTTSAVC